MRNSRRKKPAGNEDKLPPASKEAEQGILGCVLLDPIESMSTCQEAGINVDWFYDLSHRVIFGALEAAFKEGKALDLISIRQRLRDAGNLEEVGGDAYLSSLQDVVPSVANLPSYIDILREKFQLRSLGRICTQAVANVFDVGSTDGPANVEALLSDTEKSMLTLREVGVPTREKSIREILKDEVLPELDEYHRGGAQIKGLTTGFDYLDKLLCGIGGEDDFYWVLAGRPGTGKTSMALDIATHISLRHVWWEKTDAPKAAGPGQRELDDEKTDRDGKRWVKRLGVPVGIFSQEMTRKAVVKRMLFQEARADMQRWRTGFAIDDDVPRLVKGAETLAKAQVMVEDTRRQTIETLKAKARRWRLQYGMKFMIVDYLQLLRVAGKRYRDDRVQELAEISNEIQALGAELKIPVLVLAQMNRDFEKDPKRKPRLSDLKDCGAIEQDADAVAFLYEPKQSERDETEYDSAMENIYGEDWSKRPIRIDWLQAKSRYGPPGHAQLLFHKSSTHFEDWGVFLKRHNLRGPALGDRKMPTTEELGITK